MFFPRFINNPLVLSYLFSKAPALIYEIINLLIIPKHRTQILE